MSNKQRRLVTEARPLEEKKILAFELELIQEVFGWVSEIVKENKEQCDPKGKKSLLEKHRSGRVLFIDGERGSGKTSLLLTILSIMQGELRLSNPTMTLSHSVKPLLPILDFDPLPERMSIHSWLLQPWRTLLDSECGGDEDLLQEFFGLEEIAVSGWPSTHSHHGGPTEKAIEQTEQTRSWTRIQETWRKFVDNVRKHEKQQTRADGLFVVAIDDVDLQVERLPSLLHAMRLLHHPNVIYVVTGNYEHLEQVVNLHYLGRHLNLLAGGQHRAAGATDLRGLEVLSSIVESSRTLTSAFLNKALPAHSRIQMRHLTWRDIQTSLPDGYFPDDHWKSIWEGSPIDWEIARARAVQHAIDKWLPPLPPPGSAKADGEQSARLLAECNFIAELAQFSQAELKSEDAGPGVKFDEYGELTTVPGTLLRRWRGDGLSITLRDKPNFSYTRAGVSPSLASRGASVAAAILKIASESPSEAKASVSLPYVAWIPDSGPIATEVMWEITDREARKSLGERMTITLDWPLPIRPPLMSFVSMNPREWAVNETKINHYELRSGGGLVSNWLRYSLEQFVLQNKIECECTLFNPGHTPDKLLHDFRENCIAKKKRKRVLTIDAMRWFVELYLLTAPYFGLSHGQPGDPELIDITKVRDEIVASWTALRDGSNASDKDRLPELVREVKTQQEKFLDNAIVVRLEDAKKEASPKLVETLREDFLDQRRKQDRKSAGPAKDWWNTLYPRVKKTPPSPPSTRKA